MPETVEQQRRRVLSALTRCRIDTTQILIRISAGRAYLSGTLCVLDGFRNHLVTSSDQGHALLRTVQNQIQVNGSIQYVLFQLDGWAQVNGRWVYTKEHTARKKESTPAPGSTEQR